MMQCACDLLQLPAAVDHQLVLEWLMGLAACCPATRRPRGLHVCSNCIYCRKHQHNTRAAAKQCRPSVNVVYGGPNGLLGHAPIGSSLLTYVDATLTCAWVSNLHGSE
jgi:hypothetical protein